MNGKINKIAKNLLRQSDRCGCFLKKVRNLIFISLPIKCLLIGTETPSIWVKCKKYKNPQKGSPAALS